MFSCFCVNKKKQKKFGRLEGENIVKNDFIMKEQSLKQPEIKLTVNNNDNDERKEEKNNENKGNKSKFCEEKRQKLEKKQQRKNKNQSNGNNHDKDKNLQIKYQYSSNQSSNKQNSFQSKQDSQTVPYQNKKSLTQISTPKGRTSLMNKVQKKQNGLNFPNKKHSKKNIKNKNNKQKHRTFSKSNQQDILQGYLSKQMIYLNFHTSPYDQRSQFSLNYQSNKNYSRQQMSIDYSRYSQQDKQISSSQILQLDDDIQRKLEELQKLPFEQAQQKLRVRHHTGDIQQVNSIIKSSNGLHKSQKSQISRFKKDHHNKKKIDNIKCQKTKQEQKILYRIQNILDDLEDMDQQQQTIVLQKMKNLKVNQFKESKNYQKNIGKGDNEFYGSEKQQNAQHNIIKKAIETQIDLLQQQKPHFFLSLSKIPHISLNSLWTCRKQLEQIQQTKDETLYLEQTLQQAQNQFNCNSINQQFSRALLTNQNQLAQKIFQSNYFSLYSKEMTSKEKNQKDFKGYVPVHLLLLLAIKDDKLFQFAKKVVYHQDILLNQVKGPTGWSPLQQVTSFKHLRLTPHVFVACHKKKLNLIKQSIKHASQILTQIQDFSLELDIKVDSFIPLISNFTPNDTISIKKIKNKLLINYSLVGYEYLSCKRRDMGFLLDCDNGTIYAINRSKGYYCDLLDQLDKQEIQMLVIDTLEREAKKIQPVIKNLGLKEARSIFGNQISDKINGYNAKKYNFQINYMSLTQKRMPSKLQNLNPPQQLLNSPSNNPQTLVFLSSWQTYKSFTPKINIKPKNKNKKIQLQIWLSQKSQFNFNLQIIIKIFEIFSLCNPLANIINEFLSKQLSNGNYFENKFPVKIDIPINFSLFLNLEFKNLKYFSGRKQGSEDNNLKNNHEKSEKQPIIEIQPTLKKISRKQFQNIKQSKQKRSFAVNVFT